MAYPFCEGAQSAKGSDQLRPRKSVGAPRDHIAYNIPPGWARVTSGDNILPSFRYHSGGSSNILGNRPFKKQGSFFDTKIRPYSSFCLR